MEKGEEEAEGKEERRQQRQQQQDKLLERETDRNPRQHQSENHNQ